MSKGARMRLQWEHLPDMVDVLVEKVAAPAWDIKRDVSGVFTSTPAGYFWGHLSGRAGIMGTRTPAEFALCKAAAARAVGKDHVLDTPLKLAEATSGDWIKVAYSPSVRRTGEALNFFPGTYPGGIPNHPSPMAAMLASALVGGGLGYGLGWLGEKALPQGYGRNLKRTGAILGALGGAAPGAAWAMANNHNGKSIAEPWPFDAKTPSNDPADAVTDAQSGNPAVKLGAAYTRAVREFIKKADMFGGFATKEEATPYDVDVNHLGQTLWRAGASTPLLGAAMGTMYAATHMPDEGAREGWATAGQLGQLAVNAGKDYATGLALGALVNAAVGTPYSAPAFGLGGAALGLVRAGVKSLFGG